MKVKSFTSTVLLCAALFALSGCAEKAENSARTTEVVTTEAETTEAEVTEEVTTETETTEAVTEAVTEEVVEEKVASEADAVTVDDELNLEEAIMDFNSEVDFEPFYSKIKACDNAENFEGEWNSPNPEDKHFGEVTITDQTEEGFHFVGLFYQHHGEYPFEGDGPNMGDASGDAHFINDHLAICSNSVDVKEYDSSIPDSEGFAVFFLNNGKLYIRTSGKVGMMGGGVYIDGEYVLKEN